MSLKRARILEICASVNKKIHNGDAITDEELKVALSEYLSVMEFLDALNDRKYDLFTDRLRHDLETLKYFQVARNNYSKWAKRGIA